MSTDLSAGRCYIVHGRVQGVGFRYYVERIACRLGLDGYVKNRFDGTVEIRAAGPVSQLAKLEREIRSGPSLARVDRVEIREASAPPGSGFRVEY